MIKVINTSPWRSGPIRSIILRLGNRLGRVEPKKVHILLCCKEGQCGHWPYPAPAYNRKDERREMWLYLPRTFEFEARDVAFMVDISMRGQYDQLNLPEGLRRRVFIQRNYGWADEQFPMQRIPPRPIREKKPKQRPTKLQKLQARQKQIAALIKKWKRKQSAVKSTLSNHEKKLDRITKQIAKEAPDA